jgi:hypothetical protein
MKRPLRISYQCTQGRGGGGRASAFPTRFLLAITIASVVIAVSFLYAGLGSDQHGRFTRLEY